MTAEADKLIAAKAALRVQIQELRKGLDAGARVAAGRRIQAAVLALPEFAAAQRVGCYLALDGEVPTEAIVAACHAQGKVLSVPAFDRVRKVYGFVAYGPDAVMARGPLGIPQPAVLQPVAPAMLDLVVVPGLAFDARGGRVGHGGGHYDRMLAGVAAVKVAVAFDFQIVDEAPMGPRDVRMDVVVTETRVLRGL